jgi:hypothetical protein
MKVGMHIMAPELISLAYSLSPSLSVCMCIQPVARQRLGEIVAAATNTHATVEELLHAPFSIRSLCIKGM